MTWILASAVALGFVVAIGLFVRWCHGVALIDFDLHHDDRRHK